MSGERLMIIRPLGPQGPKVGVSVSEIGDLIVLDFAMGRLTEKERGTLEGVLSAVHRAGLDIVDCSPMPPEDKLRPEESEI